MEYEDPKMSLPKGRWKSYSGMRGLVCDICRVAQSFPSVVIERRMKLRDVVAARDAAQPRPQWTAIFAKAFGLACREVPALLRSHVRLPWPHLYEHQSPVACITVERQYADEEAVFFAQLRHTDATPLVKIDAQLRRCRTEPVENIGNFRRAILLSRLPGWMRRLAMWSAANASGRWRELYLGTYTISSTASLGAGIVQLISPMTGTLHYGLFDERDELDMRLTFDHRVLDGATAARALTVMENHLHGAILTELRSFATLRAAA